jgi:hypothetical protein
VHKTTNSIAWRCRWVSPPNSSRAAVATALAAAVRLIYCLLHMQDATHAQYDADKLLAVPGVRKHSVYKDSDGTLW